MLGAAAAVAECSTGERGKESRGSDNVMSTVRVGSLMVGLTVFVLFTSGQGIVVETRAIE